MPRDRLGAEARAREAARSQAHLLESGSVAPARPVMEDGKLNRVKSNPKPKVIKHLSNFKTICTFYCPRISFNTDEKFFFEHCSRWTETISYSTNYEPFFITYGFSCVNFCVSEKIKHGFQLLFYNSQSFRNLENNVNVTFTFRLSYHYTFWKSVSRKIFILLNFNFIIETAVQIKK